MKWGSQRSEDVRPSVDLGFLKRFIGSRFRKARAGSSPDAVSEVSDAKRRKDPAVRRRSLGKW